MARSAVAVASQRYACVSARVGFCAGVSVAVATLNGDWRSSAQVLCILCASVQSASLPRLLASEDFGRSVSGGSGF